MITPSFGLTATERVLPRLALDWTTGLSQAGVGVVRAGVATFVGSDGFIQSASENTQRINYFSGVSALLIEEARTNLVKNSDDIDNTTTWTKSFVSVSPNSVQSPDGATNADALTGDGTSNAHGISAAVTTTAAAHTFSIYVKKGTNNFVQLRFSGALGGFYANFNVSTGVAGNKTTTTSSIEDAGNGWYRCIVTATVSAAAGFVTVYIVNSNTSGPVEGNTLTTNVYLWGAQLEAGAFATSYIPTVALNVTRNADVPTMTGSDFDFFNASAGTFFINTNARNADVLLTAGTYTLSADATALKKYATTYIADPSATELVIGKGSIQKILYYKQALIAAELAALVA